MKQHARDDLQKIAKVDQDFIDREMSRSQRLERWIDLLERSPRQFLSTLRETEFQPSETRAAMRTDSSLDLRCLCRSGSSRRRFGG